MKHPKVSFGINKKLDIEVGSNFLNTKIGEYDFGKERIISEHPVFSKWRRLGIDKLTKNVSEYVEKYYTLHLGQIEKASNKMATVWHEIESDYFWELKKIFGSLSFYRASNIAANPSIFKCGVIEDNNQGFQIWYGTIKDKSEVRRHIAHEILHFYYYSYLKKINKAELINDWEKGEIFNRVVLNLEEFRGLTGKRDLGYAMHTNKLSKYRKFWKESSDVDKFIRKMFSKGEGR